MDLGGRGRTSPYLRDSTPCRPKGSLPLCTILRYPYLVTDPKKFLKAPWAPIYTNLRGERAPKKNAIFWSKFSKKCLKTPFVQFIKVLPFDPPPPPPRKNPTPPPPRENPRSAPPKNYFINRYGQKSAPPLEKILDPPPLEKIRSPPPPSRKS